MSRVFAGAGEEYFPDFGVWLKPGDPLPDLPEGVEVAEDDPRFVAAGSKEGRAAKDLGKHIETHGLELSSEPAETEAAPEASEDTATA